MMRAVHHPEIRKKWDKDIINTEVITVIDSRMVMWH